MNLQLLVSVMDADAHELVEKMNIATDAIIVNQCDTYGYEEFCHRGRQIRFFSMKERGVGLSRNHALLRADQEISLFSDEDIVYQDGYEEKVCTAFQEHPEADMILFNFQVNEERRTYHNTAWKQVHRYNCGRYPTFCFAIRTERMHQINVTYSLLFGGGARYSNGEDSLFIRECIRRGLKVYTSPAVIGTEEGRPSTWFRGYTEKFFYDRGVLYHYLYGKVAVPMAIQFLIRHKNLMCQEIPLGKAYQLMQKGMKSQSRKHRKS
ncbi:MAG: glycosyltransferase [Lachnospiraceae bacterium]|nr:glycosyltransferase [Lachnospiraceae bacterium]